MTRNPIRTEPDYRTSRRFTTAGNLLGIAAAANAALGVPAWFTMLRPVGLIVVTGVVVGITLASLLGFVMCRVIADRYLRYDRSDLDAVPYQEMQKVAYSMWRARHGTDAPCVFEDAARRWIARGQLPDWFTLDTKPDGGA